VDDAKVAAVPEGVPPEGGLQALEEGEGTLLLEDLPDAVQRIRILPSLIYLG